jgi:hypothetical protein
MTNAKQSGHHSTCAHAGQKTQGVATRSNNRSKAGNGGAQHHAFGA